MFISDFLSELTLSSCCTVASILLACSIQYELSLVFMASFFAAGAEGNNVAVLKDNVQCVSSIRGFFLGGGNTVSHCLWQSREDVQAWFSRLE